MFVASFFRSCITEKYLIMNKKALQSFPKN